MPLANEIDKSMIQCDENINRESSKNCKNDRFISRENSLVEILSETFLLLVHKVRLRTGSRAP